jgi:hypothetical protein
LFLKQVFELPHGFLELQVTRGKELLLAAQP